MTSNISSLVKNSRIDISQIHYKNDLKHLVSICEDVRQKKLHEINGNEFAQFLEVPGISKIQRLANEVKQNLVKVRRRRKNSEGSLDEQRSLVYRVNILALELKSAIEK